ncbi:hypothetical protein D9M68_783940 [compost metagenome]
MRDDDQALAAVRSGNGAERADHARMELARALALRHGVVFAELQPLFPGARMLALDLVGPHALDHAEMLLAQRHRGDDRQRQLLRRGRRGLLGAHEVAADEVLCRLARQTQAEAACLLVADVVERDVRVALEAQFAVPGGFAVADQDEVGGGGVRGAGGHCMHCPPSA